MKPSKNKREKPKGANLARGIVDISLLVATLNDMSPGAGDQLSQAVNHLSNRAEAQAGHRGTVTIAKQSKLDALGRPAAGIQLDNDRVTGVAEPVEGSDAINLDFWRRSQTCDELLKKIEECLQLPTEQVSGGIPDCFRA